MGTGGGRLGQIFIIFFATRRTRDRKPVAHFHTRAAAILDLRHRLERMHATATPGKDSLDTERNQT
ncbi:Hypothetical predicted protein, partial [Pelobates cultripes]